MGIVYAHIIYITVIVTMITDISGFRKTFNIFGKLFLGIDNFKLFNCSLCQSHWLSLIYLIIGGYLSFETYTFALFMSLMTKEIGNLIYLIKDSINNVIVYVSNKIN